MEDCKEHTNVRTGELQKGQLPLLAYDNALACLLVAINPVIGPLLQRASRAKSASTVTTTNHSCH